MPPNAVFTLVFDLGHPSRLRSIRRRQDLPELADPLSDPAVSSSSSSPSSRARLASVVATSTAPESSPPPAMAPSWLEPQWLEAKLTVVLSAAPGARSHHQLLLPCTVVSNPTPSELRPPLSSSPASFPASPCPTTCTTGCGSSPATRSTSPPAIWSPEDQIRSSPPSRPCRRLNAGGISPADQGFDPSLTPSETLMCGAGF